MFASVLVISRRFSYGIQFGFALYNSLIYHRTPKTRLLTYLSMCLLCVKLFIVRTSRNKGFRLFAHLCFFFKCLNLKKQGHNVYSFVCLLFNVWILILLILMFYFYYGLFMWLTCYYAYRTIIWFLPIISKINDRKRMEYF